MEITWNNQSRIMEDYPMKDGPLTDLIQKRRVSNLGKDTAALPRKLSRIPNPSVPMLPTSSIPAIPTLKKPSPIKAKPAPLVLPSSSHSFLPPFLSMFGGKEKEEEGEVVHSSRFSRLRHKKSKVDISGRSGNSEATTSALPISLPTPVVESVATAEVVSFRMSRARSHNSVTSTQFRALFPPIPIASTSSPQLSAAILTPPPSTNTGNILLPPASIGDKVTREALPIERSISSSSRLRRPKPYQAPETPRTTRNQSYTDQPLTVASLESPIRVLSPRQRSKSVSNLQSNRPKFVEDTFYSTPQYLPPLPLAPSPPSPPSQSAPSTMDSTSFISIAIKDSESGTEIAQTQCGVEEGGLSIILKSQLGPENFEVGWTCSPGIDAEGRAFTQWELKLKPKSTTTTSPTTGLFPSDYRLSSTPSSTSTTVASSNKGSLGTLPLTTSIDEFGLRTSALTNSSDFLNGPSSSPRRPSRSGGIFSASAGSSIYSEGPITPKRNRVVSSSRTLSTGEDSNGGGEERDDVEIIGSVSKNVTGVRRSSSYSAEGIEIYPQYRSSSLSSKSASNLTSPNKSPNHHHRFGRYITPSAEASNLLLRKDLKLVTPLVPYSPPIFTLEFPPALSPPNSKTILGHSNQSSISSSSSLESIEGAIIGGVTVGPTRREVNKGLRKMARGRAMSKFSDTENEEGTEGEGYGKTSWSEVKDCEEDY